MALENTNIVTTDIYLASKFVDQLKQKYIDVPEETLYLGIFGYLSSIFSNLVQNTASIAADYSCEAIPTRAKFEKNVIAHALSLGINKIFANPAEIDVMLSFTEESLKKNFNNEALASSLEVNQEKIKEIIIDKNCIFNIGETTTYPFMMDYDLIISQVTTGDGTVAYTARYDIDPNYQTNALAKMNNPYLPAITRINLEDNMLVSLQLTLRQVSYSAITKNIIVENPFETMTLTFEFEDQLAYFYVEVNEQKQGETGTTYHMLNPIYDGLFDYTSKNEWINYMFLDEKTIRLKFNRASYQPKYNSEIIVHVYTTLGQEANFSTAQNYKIINTLSSSRFSYNALYYVLQPMSDAQYGRDKYSVEKLKEYIPKEMLSRGSITTYTDLNNYFNAIQTEDCKLYLLRKVHNQIERLYYCYLLLRQDGNIIPTNTITANFTRNNFNSSAQNNFILHPGAAIFQSMEEEEANAVIMYDEKRDIVKYEKQGFLYVNPLMIVVNKTPFYVSYFNTNVNYARELYSEYINTESPLQFVALGFTAKRAYFNNINNELHIELTFSQNINVDFDLIYFDSDDEIDQCLISVYAALFFQNEEEGEVSDTPYRYIEGTIKTYDIGAGEYTFDFCIGTQYKMANKNSYMYFNSGLKEVGSGAEFPTYLYKKMDIKFYFLVRMADGVYGRGTSYEMANKNIQNVANFFPDLDGYTLTNIYNAGDEGLDLYYDYTDVMNSYVKLQNDEEGNLSFQIHKTPVVRYSWWNSEERIQKFYKALDYRKRYIQEVTLILEDSFGVDFKFYNTYGKSLCYNVDNTTNVDRVNLSLKFEIKFLTKEDRVMLPAITQSIKDYIEDMNNVTDLHMPNLITYIKNKYDANLVYIKFIKLNNYPSLWQSIYRNPELDKSYFVETQTVPEFINVNTLSTDSPDIVFDIVT